MANSEKLVFDNVNQESWTKLVSKVKNDYGVEAANTNGTATKYGYTIEWDLDQATNKLTVQCINSPSSVSSSVIDKDISNFIKANI